jgi:hypothetical protein
LSARPFLAKLICFFAVLCSACRKPAPSTALDKSAAAAVSAAETVPAQPALSPNGSHFVGEVTRGQRFEKLVAQNLVFSLEPDAGSEAGWSIRLAPGSDPSSGSIDCIAPLEEPLHGSNNLSLELPDGSDAQKTELLRPREFAFVPTPSECKVAWELMNIVNYTSELTDKDREAAGERLGKIPRSGGTLKVLEFRLRPSAGKLDLQRLDWLKFEVELPPAPTIAQVLPASSAKQSEEPKALKGIRDVDLQKFLKTRYLEIRPDLDVLEEQCPEGQDHVQSLAPFQYADLDGDGQEEAVFEGFTCMAGTAGIDFFGVLKVMPDGKLVGLPFEKEGKEFKGRNPYQGLRGHLRLEIEDARLLKVFPVYSNEKQCNSCADGGEREFVYRWDGHHFILDDIIDVPPQKSGT